MWTRRGEHSGFASNNPSSHLIPRLAGSFRRLILPLKQRPDVGATLPHLRLSGQQSASIVIERLHLQSVQRTRNPPDDRICPKVISAGGLPPFCYPTPWDQRGYGDTHRRVVAVVALRPGRSSNESAQHREPGMSGRRGLSLAQREGQQTRAQQHEACCCERQESVGDQVVFAHDAPATLRCSSESIKALRTCLSGKR
jgi:hypothetical protein